MIWVHFTFKSFLFACRALTTVSMPVIREQAWSNMCLENAYKEGHFVMTVIRISDRQGFVIIVFTLTIASRGL